jgi:hypothetical protein
VIVSSAVLLTDGEVVRGHRHYHAFVATHAKGKTYKWAVQGFLTDAGVFLDRTQAAKYAKRCGQVPRLRWSKDRLFSEDVWPHDPPEWGTRPPLWALWSPRSADDVLIPPISWSTIRWHTAVLTDGKTRREVIYSGMTLEEVIRDLVSG